MVPENNSVDDDHSLKIRPLQEVAKRVVVLIGIL